MTLEEMLGTLVADHKQQIVDKAIEKLANRLAKACLEDAKAMYQSELQREIKDLVAKKLQGVENLRIPKTNSYGEPLRDGSTYTMLELMLEKAASYLDERVDRDGRTNYGDRDRSRAQYLAQKAAEDMCKSQLQPAIDQAKSEFQKAIGGKLAGVFQETLKKALG